MTHTFSIIYPQPIYAEGLLKTIETHPVYRFQCIGQTSSAREALIKASDWIADLVIIGIHSKGAEELKLIESIRKKSKKVHILIIAGQEHLDTVRRGLVKGANGFIFAHSEPAILLEAIEAIFQKQVFLPGGFRIHPIPVPAPNTLRISGRADFHITDREIQVLKLICRGFNNKQISNDLFISDQTVAVHRKNLFRKLGVKNSISLIQLAMEKKMIG